MSIDAATVLITDMEGSTAFTADQGDETALELVRAHEGLVRSVLAEHGGREIKSMGDGFMLMFPSPATGVECALDLLEALTAHNDKHPDRPLHVRMGMNSGPLIEASGDIYGTTVNAASRIVAKARSGQVLVSEGVRADSTDHLDCAFVDRGLFWLKGLKEQWRLYEATRSTPAAYRPAISEGRTPFVDRESERAQLRMHVDAALDGRGGVVLLAGDPGAGKSRLADEIAGEAQGRGMHHFIGRCYEMSQDQPYTPLIEVLETAERRLSPELFQTALGDGAGEIARLLPHVRRRNPAIPPPADLPPEQARRFLHASARDMLASIAAVRPLCIVWDDLHWADEPTVAFLEEIAQDLVDLPILLIATYARTELTQTTPLRSAIDNLHRRRLVEQFEVGVLRPDDIATLLTSIAGAPPPEALVQRLYDQTEGNVFFFEELVRHLDERDRLFDKDGAWRSDAARLDLEVPESLRLTILRRNEHLSEATRDVLTRCAFIGRAFGFDLLEAMSDEDEGTLLDALDEAERARLIGSSSDDGMIRFRFGHELIRQTLIGEVTPARRQRMHLRVADAMETVHADSLQEHAADVAYQLAHAGRTDPDRRSRFEVMAGERTLAAAAYGEAFKHFDNALPLLTDVGERARALEHMGTCHRSLGRPENAIKTWLQALDGYDALGDARSAARLCLDAGTQVAWWLRGRQASELARRGLRTLGDEDSPLRAGLIALQGALATQTGNYDEGARLLEEALVLAQAHNDRRILGTVLYGLTTHHFTFTEYAQAIVFGEQSIEQLRAVGDLWNLANTYGYCAASAVWLGRFDDAVRYGNEGCDLAVRLGNWAAQIFCERGKLMGWFRDRPDLVWYEEDGRRALELGEAQGFRWLAALGNTRIGVAAFWMGRWDDALAFFERAAELDAPGASGGHTGGLILTSAYLGDHKRASDLLARLRPDFAQPGEPHSMKADSLALVAIEAYAIMGNDEEAGALYAVAQARLAEGVIARGWDYRLMQTVAGIAATCADDLTVAEEHFRNALRDVDALPLKLEEGDTCRFYAWMLLRRGDRDNRAHAAELLERAIEAYRRYGMHAHERMAQHMIQTA